MRSLVIFIVPAISLSIPITWSAAAQSTPPPPADGRWVKLRLMAEFWAEGACVADMDRDGRPDVLCGPFWYAAPDFKDRQEIYPAAAGVQAPQRRRLGTDRPRVRGVRQRPQRVLGQLPELRR